MFPRVLSYHQSTAKLCVTAAKAIRWNEHALEENDATANEKLHEEAEEDLEGNGNSQALQDLDDGQGTAQPSIAADIHML
jgi:hypothetical protein